MKKSRMLINGGLVVAVLTAGGLTYQATRDEAVAAVAAATEKVTKADVTSSVSASGQIESSTKLSVRFTQQGRVTKVLVQEGDTVTEGQELARLDDSLQQAAVVNAKASLSSAKAKQQRVASGLSSVEAAQNAAQAKQSLASVESAELTIEQQRATQASNKITYQSNVDQARASVVTAEEALVTAEKKAAADDAAAEQSVVNARAGVERAKRDATTDTEVAQAAVTSAEESVAKAEVELNLLKGNLTTAQNLFDTGAARYPADLASVVARYVDDQTVCKNKGTPADGVTCDHVADVLAPAQSAQKQESSVTQAKTSLTTARNNLVTAKTKGEQSVTSAETTLTNALNTQRTTRSSGQQSVTTAKENITTAKSKVTDALDTQRSSLLKDAQSVASAEQQLVTARKTYESQLAANAVKAKPPTAAELAAESASVAQAEEQVRKSEKNLDDTVLKAPITGKVATINGVVGDEIGTSTTGFIDLTNTESLHVKVGFSEADAINIKVGQLATVTLDADDTRVFTGKVTSIDDTQTLVSNVVTYYADVNLVGDVEGLRPGLSTTVDVRTETREQVLSLPTRAITGSGRTGNVTIRTTDEQGEVVDTPTRVTVGVRGDERVEITDGVKEGDVVVLPSSTGGLPGGIRLPGGGGLGGGLGG